MEITGVLHYLGKRCEIFDRTVKLQDHVNKINLGSGGRASDQVTGISH